MKMNLQQIDDLLKSSHSYLEDEDKCYFLGEYTPREDYKYSEMNDFILNFKKSPKDKNTSQWKYKKQAIQKISNTLASLKVWDRIKTGYTWIPIPPSRVESDPLYDDRLLQVLRILKNRENTFDYRELIKIKSNRRPAHNTLVKRPKPIEHYNNYKIDPQFLQPPPEKIIIFDDIITTGSGFKAMQRILKKNYPNADIFGLFIARSVHT